MEGFQEFIFWFISKVPYAYQFSKFIHDKTGLPMIEGVLPGDSLMNFSGVILAATMIAVINLAFKLGGKHILDGLKKNYLGQQLIDKQNLVSFFFGLSEKTNVGVVFVYFLASSLLGWIAAPAAGFITTWIEDKLMSGFTSMEKTITAFITCVIIFFAFSLVNNVIHWADNGFGARFPIVRAFTATILPDVIKLLGTTLLFILGFMFFLDTQYLNAVICWIAGCLFSFGVYILGDFIEMAQTMYYLRVTKRDTLSNTFGLFSELFAIVMFYQIMSVNMINTNVGYSQLLAIDTFNPGSSSGSILEYWLNTLPFLKNFVFQRSIISTLFENPSYFSYQLAQLILLCLIFCSIRRIFYLIPRAAAPFVEGFGWWIITVLVFCLSIGLYVGAMAGVDAIIAGDEVMGPGIVMAIAVLLLLLYCCLWPAVIQHICIIPVFIILLSVLMHETGLGGSCGLINGDDELSLIRFALYTLAVFALGYALGFVRALTKPRFVSVIRL